MTPLARLRAAAVCLALAAAACPSSAQQGPDWVVMAPGPWPDQYLTWPIPAPGHPSWLALVAGAHRWTLEPAVRDWSAAHDRVDASLPGTLVFLRHDALRAGPAPTPDMKFSGHARRFEPGSPPFRLAFAGDSYEIVVHDRAVWLRQGDRSTRIGRAYVADNTGEAFDVDLLWAGDLDRDGRLDLITREHYGGYSEDLCLYLSSPPRSAGELLVKIGCESWSG